MEIQNIEPEILGFLGIGLGSFLAANILFFIIFILFVLFLPYIFFLIHLSKIFNKCSVKNKKMDGGLVWLLLIPIFNIGWLFYVIIKLRDSLQDEFKSRNFESDDPEFSFSIGLAYAITTACSIIPVFGIFCSLAAFILWIVYWIKINKYSTQLNLQTIESDLIDN